MLTNTRSKNVLGICVGDHGMLIAESPCASATLSSGAIRVAEFNYPPGVTLEKGEALGTSLREFLQSQGFSTTRAVYGIPARWMLLKSHSLPPADPQTAATMLWLRAETSGMAEVGEMVFDYIGRPDPQESSAVVLVGLAKKKRDQLLAIGASAGLKIESIVPTGAALADVAAIAGRGPLILSLGRENVELLGIEHHSVHFLKHLGASSAKGQLIAELRRATATLAHSHYAKPELVLWNEGQKEDADLRSAIESAVGMPLIDAEIPGGGASGRSSVLASPAAAIALSAQSSLPDFLHPRLNAPRAHNRRPTAVVAAVMAACVALFALAGYIDILHLNHQVADADAQLVALQPKLKAAKPFVDSMEFARTFEAKNPKCLAALRELTSAMPKDGQTYLTSFNLQSNMRGEFSGRSSSDQSVVSLMDKLSSARRFTDLKRKMDERQGKAGNEVSYSVTFKFVP
ncbi:MAG TPA: PilN domain-containing protein [Tepidisphaeraceae bacterium]|nr:PilN domain-containing protein [Tepidisphaeraceae bacterium]